MITCTLYLARLPIQNVKNPFFGVCDAGFSLLDYVIRKQIYTSNNFQVQKFAVDMTIRVNRPLSTSASSTQAYFPNYCCMKQVNYDVKYRPLYPTYEYFYFVVSQKYISQETTEFVLRMDVLNTFPQWKNNLTSRTRVIREHEDRFLQTSATTTFAAGTRIPRYIDWKDEGFHPELRRYSSIAIQDGTENQSYYLIYKTKGDVAASDPQPIGCFLCGDEWIKGKHDAPNGSNSFDPPGDNEYYHVFFKKDNRYLSFGIYTNNAHSTLLFSFSGWQDDDVGIAIEKGSGFPQINILRIKKDAFTGNLTSTRISNENIQYDVTLVTAATGYRPMSREQYPVMIANDAVTLENINSYTFTAINIGIGSDYWCEPISRVDRSDTRLVKIVKIPYKPVNSTTDANGVVTFAGFGFNFVNHLFWLTDFATEFSHAISKQVALAGDGLYVTLPKTPALSQARALVDSKLWNSAFMYQKMLYDSFSKAIQFERVSPDIDVQPAPIYISFTFKPTNTLNSRMAFKWDYTDQGENEYLSGEDYAHYLLCARNNEVLIYSSDYTTYLKTGYNYDVKNKDLANIGRWLGFGLGAAGSGAQVAVGALTGNPFTAAQGIGAMSNTASSLASAIVGQISDENRMAKTISQGQAQSASVSGADDSDLLRFYEGDKLHLVTYKARQEILDSLNNYFYYYGYACDEFKIPDLNTRIYFNYIECDPVFTDEYDEVLPQEIIDEIKAKCVEGITCFHNADALAQNYENYERWLIS